MTKRQATVDEIVAAIEAPRHTVIADEVTSLTNPGIPQPMASKLIANSFPQTAATPQQPEPAFADSPTPTPP